MADKNETLRDALQIDQGDGRTVSLEEELLKTLHAEDEPPVPVGEGVPEVIPTKRLLANRVVLPDRDQEE